MKPPRYLLREFMVKRLLEQYPRGKFLEVGYGGGDMLVTMARLGFMGDGFDFSELARQETTAKLRQEQITSVKLLNDIPTKAHYDWLTFYEVIGYWSDPIEQLKELSELVHKQGHILFSFTNAKHAGAAQARTGNMRCFNALEITTIVKSAGLKVEKIVNYGFPLTNIMSPFLHLYHLVKSSKKVDKEAVKRSGLAHHGLVIRCVSFVINRFTIYPFLLLQLLFRNTNLGTGYLVIAKK